MALDEQQSEHDIKVESNGIDIIYNSGLEEHVGNITIDYEDSMMQRGFVMKGSDTFC